MKKVISGITAFLMLVSIVGTTTPVRAGTPFIQGVMYISPTTFSITFSEAMDETTSETANKYTLVTAVAGDTETIDTATLNTTGDSMTVILVAGGAKINPGDTVTVSTGVGAPKSSATSTIQSEGMPKQIMMMDAPVVISEIQTAGATADDEFVEIYNRSPMTQDLNGWKLKVMDSAGTETQLVADIASTIASHGFLLMARATSYDGTPTADKTFASAIGSDSTILLYDNNNTVKDLVGFGSALLKLVTAAPNPVANGSIERKASPGATVPSMTLGGLETTSGNPYNSFNNFFDFLAPTTSVPQSSVSATETPPEGGGGMPGGYGAGKPFIDHMSIQQGKAGAELKVFARIFDQETSTESLTAKLYYKVNSGAWSGDITGNHLANGFFRFIIPDSDMVSTNVISYYLKATDGDSNSRYMTQNPSLDMSDSVTAEQAQAAPFTFTVVDGSAWTRSIAGTVKDSTDTAIAGAIVYIPGTGFNTISGGDGTYSITGIGNGVYDVAAFAVGKGDMWRNGVSVTGANATGINFNLGSSFSGGMGGDYDKPRVMGIAPMQGMIGAPIDINLSVAPIMIMFSKAMDETSFTDTSIFISTDGTVGNKVAGISKSYNSTTNQLKLYSATNLTKGTMYAVVVTPAVKDAAGNALDGDNSSGAYVSTFTTFFDSATFGGTGGAVFPPYVTGTTPTSGAFNVSTNTAVTVMFSDPMDATTITSSNIKLYKGETLVTGTIVALDSQTLKIATVSGLTLTSGNYSLRIYGAVKSATGIQAHTTGTQEIMRSNFSAGSTSDAIAPTIAGSSLEMYKSTATCAVTASGCITGVPTNVGVIDIGFSEAMDASTLGLSSITLKKGSSELSTNIVNNPMSNSITVAPLTALSPNSTYTLTITTAVKDLAANALAASYIALFTTGASVDTTAPSVMYANADDFSIAVTFSKSMNATKMGDDNYTGSVLNKTNYTVKQGPPASVVASGASVSLANASITYDPTTFTATIKGVQMTPTGGTANDFYIVAANVKDVSGNAIGGTASAQSPVNNSSTTGGMVGPGGGGTMMGSGMTTMTGFGSYTASDMGMSPVSVMPMNMMAGMTSNYFVNFPTTKAIVNGSTMILTFPSGFDVTNAAKNATSPSTKDLNGPGAGIVAFDATYDSDGVAVDVISRTVTIKFAVSGGTPPASDFLNIDLMGIKNSSIPKDFNTSGYTVDMKTKDSAGTIMESKTSMPFFIKAGGSYKISGTITATADANTGTMKVFLGSPATGPMEATSGVFGASVSGQAAYEFNNLPAGEYFIWTEPTVTINSNDYFGANSSEPARITDANVTKNITLAVATGGVAITVKATGTFVPAEGNLDVFAGGPNGFAVKTVTPSADPYSNATLTTLYLPASDGIYSIGMGPAMPRGTMAGPPPQMSFVPPPSQEIKVVSGVATPSTILFTVSSANRTISGTVTDGTNPIANAEVFAYQPQGGFGVPPAKTAADGTFSIKVSDGSYKVGAMMPGLPMPTEQAVTVSGASVSGVTLKLKKPSYTISGKVTDGTNAIPYAPVFAHSSTGEFANSQTDSSGNYILYVNPGTWQVEGDAPGFGKLPALEIIITTASQASQNLRPAVTNMATVSGTVSIGGAAASKVGVMIEGIDASSRRFNNFTNTGSDGTYQLKVPGGTTYTVRAWAPGYGDLIPIAIATIAEGATITGKDFTIAAGATATITIKIANTAGLVGPIKAFVNVFDPSTGRGSNLDIQDITASPTAAGTITLPKTSGLTTYKAFMHIPGFGEFGPTVVGGSLAQNFTLTADANLNFSLSTTNRTIIGRVYKDTDVSGHWDSGEEVREAFVWLFNKTTGTHNGTQTAADGTYSLNVSDGSYDVGVDKPGYTSPAPTALTIAANVADQNFVLTTNDQTISGTITSNGTTPVTNAWVWAEKITSATDFTLSGGWSGNQTDPSGVYSLAVSNGYWLVHANAPGYKETKYVVSGTPTAIRVNSDSPSSKNITLIADTGFIAKAPQSQSITPANATTFNDTVNGVSMEIPANALGSDSSSNTSLSVQEVTAPASTVVAPLGGLGKEISATKKVSATESQSITTLDSGSATITITYDDADIPDGISEDQLTLSYYDSSVNQWVEITAVQDTTLNTLTGTTTHFSTFAPTYPTGSTPPSTPGTPTGTAGNGSVAITWTASTDDVGVTGYEVYRSTTVDGTYTNISGNATADGGWNPAILVTSTSYTDSTAVNGTAYYYKVAAYDAAQNQSTSSSASAGLTPVAPSGGGGGYIAPTPASTTNGQVTATRSLGGITTLTNSDSTSVKVTVPANTVTSDSIFVAASVASSDSSVTAPAVSTNLSMVGKVYNLSAVSGSIAVTTFSQPVTLEFTYKDSDIPTGATEDNLGVYYYDATAKTWAKVTTSSIDKSANKITVLVTHFTQFAILADITPAAEKPAEVQPPVTGITPSSNPSDYNFEYISQSTYPEIASGKVKAVTLKIKNTGTATWYKTGSYPVHIGTSNTQDRRSRFVDETNWLSGNRVASFQEAQVAPGETATFTFNLLAPTEKGVYKEYFQPVVDGLTWMKDVGIFWTVTVNETYHSKWKGQGSATVVTTDGATSTWIEFENTGTATWYKSGTNPVRLGTSHEHDRASIFNDSSWLSDNRINLIQDTVAPGGTGRFEFNIKSGVGTAGTTYREYFQPVADGLAWMEDDGVYWDIVK